MTNKTYADAKGHGYSYTPSGRVRTRTWARGVTTTNDYNSSGDVSNITYSDGTASVALSYDRRRRPIQVGGSGSTSALAYNDAGELLSESWTAGPLSGLTVTNAYDSLWRRTNVALSGHSSTFTQLGYDGASRLTAVTNGLSVINYGYLTNSPLVNNVTSVENGTTRLTTTKSYDNLDRLTAISSVPSASSPISFNYAYNSANQRTAITNADASRWMYQYDTLGQVISGRKIWNDATPVAGQQFEYSFDDIGNRKMAVAGGDQWGVNLRYASYTSTNLNQYINRTVPKTVDVIGSATNTATVTVNNQPTYRKGDYFRGEVAFDNATGPVFESLTNLAVLNQGTNSDLVTSNVGKVFLPGTPENFRYDADGNLTNDGRWTFVWDGENRLVMMTNNANVPSAAKLKLDFSYDYFGRRLQKIVSTNNGSISVEQSRTKFVYDGGNLLATLDGQSTLVTSFTWGLDLSGTPQGAGGVGGLLKVHSVIGGAHFVSHDGNGNVAALIKVNDGTISANYEYGPFGELIRASGTMAKANPFRFSTKYQDDETDLIYYWHRYYSTSSGSWLSRDPIENAERSQGPNLYAFVGSDPVNRIDSNGREIIFVSYSKKKLDIKPSEVLDLVKQQFDENLELRRLFNAMLRTKGLNVRKLFGPDLKIECGIYDDRGWGTGFKGWTLYNPIFPWGFLGQKDQTIGVNSYFFVSDYFDTDKGDKRDAAKVVIHELAHWVEAFTVGGKWSGTPAKFKGETGRYAESLIKWKK